MILLVIDMQKGLVVDELYDYQNFLNRTLTLIKEARKSNVEIIFFKHDAGSGSGLTIGEEDFELIDEIELKPNEKVYTKTINSCFGNESFKEYMDNQKDKRLMIIGLQTNYCIDCTIKSAFEKGYEVIIPEGTNSTFDNPYMSAEVTYDYYNDDVWEELVNSVTIEEATKLLRNNND